jgi:hypothetical protein
VQLQCWPWPAILVALCGSCDTDGPAVESNPQTIVFAPLDVPAAGQTSVVVSAVASSGLPVRYGSLSPTLCSANSETGLVAALSSGVCAVSADQGGNAHYAPAAQAKLDIPFALTREPSSNPVDFATGYQVVATFYEPDTQPNNSIFVGSYTLDATTGVVANLHGRLSESMTGGATGYPSDTMTWLTLDHQLSSLPVTIDGAPGLLVTTFALETTNTLSSLPALGGTDGFSPGTGMGLHFDYPGANPSNAYVRIFVNLADPIAQPTQAQIDKLAYADCTPGGMMGATCMTGTSVAGYGSVGSMSGYPLLQTTTKRTSN